MALGQQSSRDYAIGVFAFAWPVLETLGYRVPLAIQTWLIQTRALTLFGP